MEDLVFTIGPGTVTGYWVRTWRANDDKRGSPPRSESRNQTNLGPSCRIEHHTTNAASVRPFGERETVKVTLPEALGEEHGAEPETVDDCRVRHRAAALAAVLVRLISCR